MVTPQIARYGSWKSPITSNLVVSEAIEPSRIANIQFALDSQDTYWIEPRPNEGGRNAIVRRTPNGRISNVTPPGYNVRTQVHEYGGGGFVISNGTLYFSNFSDQRVYRQLPGQMPWPLTPALEMRYADGVIDQLRGRIICVREDHTRTEIEAANTLVSIALDGNYEEKVLVSGNDFYASPRLSHDGSRLAWLTWNHPNMPWDGTELWVGSLAVDGTVNSAECVAGGFDESIFQPEWSPDGILHFVSDRTGWWNLYSWRDGQIVPLCPKAAEFGSPQWVFGLSNYGFVADDHIICSYVEQGIGHIASLHTTTGKFEPIEIPYTTIWQLRTMPGRIVFTGGSPTEPGSIVQLDLDTSRLEVLRRFSSAEVDAGYLSMPESIEFATEQGKSAYGFFYPPRNHDYLAPQSECPPLLVMSHGGPTAATNNVLDLHIQYWTSRGIAVLDVNYGGSTGYGRAYRKRLEGRWGIVDVDDCVNGAKYLAERGEVDIDRLIITGGSAGGYTTLCALTFRDIFKAGASHYGISDLEAMTRDTHKFESRYLDRLVGPYPERRDLYKQRSSINYTELLSCPVIFFQGLEDKVVPPNQAELMVKALRTKGLPVAYMTFEGEQHGFRRSKNIKCVLESEFYFYSCIFGFVPAEPIEPVYIENF
jgi:dipeptidyl aminopeptidase/acylaminoacyl peptidase